MPRLRLGRTVRAHDINAGFVGRLTAFDVAGLTARTAAGREAFLRWEDVDSLWVARHPMRYGAIIGGVVGMTPVVLTCGAAVDECGLVPYGILLPAVGVALGSLIGAAFPKWQRLYP